MDDGVDKGTPGCSGWYFIDAEAECSENDDAVDNFEALFEQSTQGSFLDNDEVDQGNSLALFTEQLFADDEQHIAALKRKHVRTPQKDREIDSLSPRLHAVSISPRGKQSRRRLFEDSGIGHETEDTATEEVLRGSGSESASSTQSGGGGCEELLRASNRVAASLGKFKDAFGVSFSDLTRNFKSNKTCSTHWVVTAFGARETLTEAAKEVLRPQCKYLQEVIGWAGNHRVTLWLLELTVQKSRETLNKQLSAILGVDEKLIMADPPNHRSTLAALFFYKKTLGREGHFMGSMPEWVARQTILEHQQATAEAFDFSAFVQWAYDNDYTDESEIAYRYALEAETDLNAEAWLKTNNQVKYVRDCCAMVRMYKRQEMKEMSMSAWVSKCCSEHDEGDWKIIAAFLRYQEVNMVMFLTALRHMFIGTPKKHCLVLIGPSDTGKSYFCSTLTAFLHGRVISYMNSKSQFWLQPLIDAKIGFLDDATIQCWNFMDTFMRNGLDGNYVQVDIKHRAPLQLKLPPLLITSNVDVMQNDNFKYLRSRLQCFSFNKPMPLDEKGQPQFPLTSANWTSFFKRLAKQLGLEEEEVDNEHTGSTFRCSTRSNSQLV
nr:E1 protein [Rodent papillomavirus]